MEADRKNGDKIIKEFGETIDRILEFLEKAKSKSAELEQSTERLCRRITESEKTSESLKSLLRAFNENVIIVGTKPNNSGDISN